MSGSGARAQAEAAKAAKQKKILAVTSVVFLALVGFQLPKLMSHGGATSAAPPTDTAAVPAAPASPDGSSSIAPEAAPSTGDTGLPDTDRVTIQPGSGQLVSFGLFKSKDPFVQQVGANAGVATPTPVVAPPVVNTAAPLVTTPTATTSAPHTPPRRTAPNGGLTPVTTTAPTLTTPSVISPSTTPISTPAPPTATTPVRTTTTTATTATTPATPAVAPTSVSISTNGECEVVAKNGTFPQQEDIFRVVSIAKDGKSAKISVVGGAYDSGAASVALELGKKLTLVNTADGTRYVLLLQSKCDVQTSAVSGGTGVATVPTSTVAPPTTTAAVTTPIVTDALDTTPVGG